MRKKILQFMFLLTGIFLLIYSCRQELSSIEQNHEHSKIANPKFKITNLNGKDAQKLFNAISPKLESLKKIKVFSKTNSEISLNIGTIDYSKIVEVVDSLGITNYTFRVYHPDDNQTTFHNLVVNKNGNQFKFNLLKYELNKKPSSKNQKLNSSEEFTGTVTNTYLDDGGNCTTETGISGGGGGGSDGSGSGGTGGSSGGGGGAPSGCTVASYYVECLNCGRTYGSWSSFSGAVCGNGSYPYQIVITYTYKYLCKTTTTSCNPDGGIAVIATDPKDIDFCNKLKSQNTNANYKAKFDELNTKANFNLKFEKGYSENNSGDFTSLNTSTSTTTSDGLKLPINANNKGYIHTHVNEYENGETDEDGNVKVRQPIRMFSPADVNALMELAQLQTGGNYGDIYGTMISSYGNYTIKFTGDTSNIQTGFDTDDWRKSFQKFIIDENGRLEKKFLRFMRDKMQIEGISLYEIKDNGKIIKKTIDSNNNIIKTECPN